MTTGNPSALAFHSVSKAFGTTEVLREVSFEVLSGEFVAIVGPSGCGKTTLLNAASQFDQPDSGTINVDGRIRMVYQKDGLFPWLTVAENIELGVRDVKDKNARTDQVDELLALIQLAPFRDHYPHQLSGGMRQRVELARSLGGNSDILLLDEPFSALDYITRIYMRSELARILSQRPRTVLLVTHDIEEAAQLADRIFVLSSRPSQIRFELSICAPRPRELTHPEVLSATEKILYELGLRNSQLGISVPQEMEMDSL
jgi:NitT/TauT family transport system ATP-binding protein